ncbi:hypothetical protein NQ315_010431 [Exocentrus adspersus]|uniref:Lipocalin/cytosolic fatty-acid binding domain-containing protein n=1 Tax=Exocentrus adspersus TaxID=1586481 RepID=A0AAV8WBI6_9CUCU|nr:hypothetical protein NQ315_010431 [Exocentrus adspersus]
MFKLLIFLTFAYFAQTQVPSLERCPNVTTVSDFKLNEYLGKWYEAKKYFMIFELSGRCITATYKEENGTITVLNEEIETLTGSTKTIEGTAKNVGNADEAKLAVTFPELPVKFEAPYWVLETDYTGYSVVWSCVEYGPISTRFAWVLTREQNPSTEVLDKAYAVFDKQNLDKELLLDTDQTDCPSDNN